MKPDERRIAAIVVADVVGYSAMVEADETATLSRLFAMHAQLVEPAVERGAGRVVKTTGDGLLAEFPSVVNAVQAAVDVQRELTTWHDVGDLLQLRIGVHVGDVAVRDGDILGDAVNIAARLEAAAQPGGILISGAAHDHLAGHFGGSFASAGELELKNISRPIPAWRWTGAPPHSDRGPRATATKPTIAVLPFDNLSGDKEQDYWAAGMVEDLITMLSRFHWFRVMARTSSFALGERAEQSPEGKDLGVRYLLNGSVRREGTRLRVSSQLVDADDDVTIWADRFDQEVENLFEMQDQMVGAIVGSVVPGFVSSFQLTRQQASRTTLSSWELAMQGWNLAWRSVETQDSMPLARDLFERALGEDDRNTLAHCGLAFSFSNPYYQAQLERDVPRAMAAAKQALLIDEQDAFAWCLSGVAAVYANDHVEAERRLKRAIAINPSMALAHGYMAMVSCYRPDSAATDYWAEQMENLSPADPMVPMGNAARSMARFGEADYSGALAMADKALAQLEELQPAWRLRAASLEMLGDHEAASAAVEKVLELGPVTMNWLRKEATPLARPEAWDAYLSALRAAGVPD